MELLVYRIDVAAVRIAVAIVAVGALVVGLHVGSVAAAVAVAQLSPPTLSLAKLSELLGLLSWQCSQA